MMVSGSVAGGFNNGTVMHLYKGTHKAANLGMFKAQCHNGLHVTVAGAMSQDRQPRRQPSSLAIIRFDCQDWPKSRRLTCWCPFVVTIPVPVT
jgi:hypothetical protein